MKRRNERDVVYIEEELLQPFLIYYYYLWACFAYRMIKRINRLSKLIKYSYYDCMIYFYLFRYIIINKTFEFLLRAPNKFIFKNVFVFSHSSYCLCVGFDFCWILNAFQRYVVISWSSQWSAFSYSSEHHCSGHQTLNNKNRHISL